MEMMIYATNLLCNVHCNISECYWYKKLGEKEVMVHE